MNKNLGAQIVDFRQRKNLSQAELGELVGVHQTAISFIERGVNYPSLSTLLSLARALGIDVPTLFTEYHDR